MRMHKLSTYRLASRRAHWRGVCWKREKREKRKEASNTVFSTRVPHHSSLITHRSQARGIVLTEAIIAVGVAAAIFTAVLGLLSRSMGGIRASTDQVTATYLAQDAMEYIVAKIVYNKRSGAGWLDGVSGTSGCPNSTTPCMVETGRIGYENLSSCGGTCALHLTTGGYYTHTVGSNTTPTKFSRSITVLPINLDTDDATYEEAKVTVTVSWTEGSRSYAVPLTFNLYAN